MKTKGRKNGFAEPQFKDVEFDSTSLNDIIEDGLIKVAVTRCLELYSRVPLERVNISVEQGYAMFHGMVLYPYQKIVTSKMLAGVKGLHGIVNNIGVLSNFANPQ